MGGGAGRQFNPLQPGLQTRRVFFLIYNGFMEGRMGHPPAWLVLIKKSLASLNVLSHLP